MRNGRAEAVKTAVLILLCVLLLCEIGLFVFSDDLFRLHYRKEYAETVEEYASEYGVPATLVYAVILCESGFDPSAESRVGAKGLMQMMDVSFREMRERIGLTGEGDPFDPEQNVQCGVYCLAHLKSHFGNWDTALAAYNAGIGNVQDWLKDGRYGADGETLSAIPFAETAAYLKRVRKAENAYRELYKD